MISFETETRVARTIEEVFSFVSDPLQFPRWNSAVRAVHSTKGQEPAVGSTYVMERDLPTGRQQNQLEIIELRQPSEFAVRTTSGPTPFVYRYRLSSEFEATNVHLDATVELTGLAAVLAPLAARAVKRGVNANFARLREVLEATPH